MIVSGWDTLESKEVEDVCFRGGWAILGKPYSFIDWLFKNGVNFKVVLSRLLQTWHKIEVLRLPQLLPIENDFYWEQLSKYLKIRQSLGLPVPF